MTKQQPAQHLEDLVAKQLTDRRFSPVTYDDLTKKITYVTAKNGLFKVTKTPIGLFKELLQENASPIPGIPEMSPGVDLVIPKIPFKLLIEALTYYRDIAKKDKTEASTLFFWNHKEVALPNIPGLRQEGQIIIYCPVQTNSPALSDFEADEHVHWLREHTALLLELHSHVDMSAFFSGTDDANENMTQFYAVWGKVSSEKPQFEFRYVVGDTKEKCDPTVLIDWPSVEKETKTTITETLNLTGDFDLVDFAITDEDLAVKTEEEVEHTSRIVNGPFKRVEYPADWMAQHTKRVYASSYGGGKFPYRSKTPQLSGNTYSDHKQTQLALGYDEDSLWEEYHAFSRTHSGPTEFFNDVDYSIRVSPYHSGEVSSEMEEYLLELSTAIFEHDEGIDDFTI